MAKDKAGNTVNAFISAATLPDDAAAVVTAAVQVLNPAGWEVKDGKAVIDTQVNAMWDSMVKAVGITSEQAHAAIFGTMITAPYAMMSAAAERAMQDHLNALAAGGDATASTSVRAEGSVTGGNVKFTGNAHVGQQHASCSGGAQIRHASQQPMVTAAQKRLQDHLNAQTKLPSSGGEA